jgi:antitoxin PrlF
VRVEVTEAKEKAIASTTLASKGQMTLPKEIRDRLILKAGDRLEVSTDGDYVIMTPSTLDIDDLCQVLPEPKHAATVDEIDSEIRRRAAGEFH